MNEEEIRKAVREAVRQTLAQAPPPHTFRAPWTGATYEAHPSRAQFNINEASTEQHELLEFIEAQLCTIEKNRQCDHCGLCKSLGF